MFFPFKRKLRKETVADILFKDVFSLLADNIHVFLPDGLDKYNINNQCKLECFALLAFLMVFSFKQEFEYLGPDSNQIILDRFHIALFNEVNDKNNKFPELLETRYGEYFPLMNDDIKALTIEDTIPFQGIMDSFLEKIAPDKLHTPESLTLSLSLVDIYAMIRDSYSKIKKYKIG